MNERISINAALQKFAASVTDKMAQLILGEPEAQIRSPFETFMHDAASVLGWNVDLTDETSLPDRLGRPDYAVHLNQLLAGYVELKAPGVGVTATRFRGHNRDQFKRFSAIPNILYTDGNEWALYRDGKLVDRVVRLSGDVAADGGNAVVTQDAHAVERLLRDFLSWEPFIPIDRNGKIDLKGFALLLAPLCCMLRDDVTDALKNPDSPLVQLAGDWRQLLFPDATDEQFADAYAQTVAFALLLGRSEGADPISLESAVQALDLQHNLLSRALQVLTDPNARADIAASLDLLLRVIGVVPPATLTGPKDPWLYFYEDFLAVYDPKLRKDAGAYYTPVEVVRTQVRLIDDLLVHRLDKPLGFADPDVVTLDPAVGTGTYLLGVIEHALGRIEAEQGAGAVAGQATTLAENLYGFERMVGPYAVSELRVSRALRDRGADLPQDGPHVYLTDTLESPHAEPLQLPLFMRPIAEQRIKALEVKREVPVIVCLGNPPYDRHEAATPTNGDRTGSWVRWGDNGKSEDAILYDFLNPAIDAGYGVHLKNLYNLYVYFWRWALWKVFEQDMSGGGVVSFITASSYLDGDAFCGMREHMRRQCEEIWILDLGGEGRGTRQSDNVFAIQTPVAIAVAFRSKNVEMDTPARVHYARIEGTRQEKLAILDAIDNFANVEWQDCADEWQGPFRPAGEGDFFAWPLLTDLMPWQQSGVQAGRTWVISSEQETLNERWRTLLQAKKEERKQLFKDSPTGRKVHETPIQLSLSTHSVQKSIADLPKESLAPNVVRFAYRSFDRQFLFGDARLLDRPGPTLWNAHGERQVYLTTLLNHPLGQGPAVTACALIPDRHHFRGSYGGKDIFPLYRSSDASEANILPGLLARLGEEYGYSITPEDFLAYIYGMLAQPVFTARFTKELDTRELRVPITKDVELFEQVRDIGTRLLWLHTYGERFVPEGESHGHIPSGVARCTKAVPSDADGYPEAFDYNDVTETLRVGVGEFAPVAPEVYEFEVSGLKVVQSWLKYRMKKGAGRKSSPLDHIRPVRWTSQFTTELLELLWVLEATVAGYPEQENLFEAIVAGDCFQADELPPVPDAMREAPSVRKGDLFD